MSQHQQAQQRQETVAFSHVHLYVDKLEDLSVYKDLEAKLCQFSAQVDPAASIEAKRRLWQSLDSSSNSHDDDDTALYVPQNRDVVKQLLASFGFRVTGARYHHHHHRGNSNHQQHGSSTTTSTNTRSVLVTSRDPEGVQIVVTALEQEDAKEEEEEAATTAQEDDVRHFDASKLQEFSSCHHGFQGISVLAFMVQDVERIKDNYQRLHPELIADCQVYDDGNTKVLEVYAYYEYHEQGSKERLADKGTILRFIQDDTDCTTCHLPGLDPVDATFEDNTGAAYCDHWVSNVFSRTEFLETLQDTLGFTPKVDFNAGVVAAGEAQIESTVTGNDSDLATSDKKVALKDQSQVYLPINNALSSVGHVHGFLQELGQGVQHVVGLDCL